MKRILRFAAVGLLGFAAIGLCGLAAVFFGACGHLEADGEITRARRPAARVAAEAATQDAARRDLAAQSRAKQILFGDLHVHTTYSLDAFLHSLPLMQGEGAHPPADACDFARFCSALDFFSLNDHAESLTPTHWQETKQSIRQCNAVAGDPQDPDLVAFLGWEWTQMGLTPESHYGHKNVVFRDTGEEQVPTRPIAARGVAYDGMRAKGGRAGVVAMSLFDFGNRQRYYDFAELRQEIRRHPLCEEGVDVRALPADCAEAVATPRELFAKLAQWDFPSLVIPHGNAWGNTTPAGVSWDKQLANGNHDPTRQTLIEVYSGHGNSEPYRPWRQVETNASGEATCPAPSEGFEPGCWRAGEIIRERCVAAGETGAECERRAVETRERYLAAGSYGRFVVPGQTPEDWLDAGQCTDCYQPAFDLRPGGSSQYALTATNSAADPEARRFRFGFIASSDTHFARAATGYKELDPLGWTDIWGAEAAQVRRPLEPGSREPTAESIAIDPTQQIVLPGGNVERSASFYYSGGLVAVHSDGRDRGAVWDALRRKEVYGTSGPRILLWFDLRNGPEGLTPMGSAVRMHEAPRLLVRAVGALEQQPGCPDHVTAAMAPERLAALCRGECHNPGGTRHRITRIEVVRIRPRRDANEDAASLIDDPWRVYACPDDPAGCRVEFSDAEYPVLGRDTVYYVRAIQAPTLQVNGGGLRCERDEAGVCIRPHPCRAGDGDSCLAEDEARAWSSPIFVDWAG